MLSRRIFTSSLALTLGLSTAGCSGSATNKNTVKIGTTEGSAEYWQPFEEAAEKEGITIQPVNFSDYTQANPAVVKGQTDLNMFQHITFLADYNVRDAEDLTPIGSTYIVPLSLYSQKYKTPAEIPQGGKIAIPNDPTNQARALMVLQNAGLLKLKDGGNTLSSPADILPEGQKVEVQPIDAAQTAAILGSLDGAIINNDKAVNAGLDLSSAIYKNDPNSPQSQSYINVIVSREADKNNEKYQKVVKAYQDPTVQAAVEKEYKNTAVMVNKSPAELDAILREQENLIKAANQ